MMATWFTILFTTFAVITFGQQKEFDFDEIRFRGLGISATREIITKSFGQPEIVNTDYDCGFFTNDQPGGPYYQLVYEGFNYIGSDKEKFYLEHINFDSNGQIEMQYGDMELNGLSTKADFIAIFGDRAKTYFKENPGEDSILLLSHESDDGVVFTFKGNRLIKFQYWTPC